jgi:hypothetical protein
MIDLCVHLLHFCQSCVSDAQSVAPAVGVLGGAAGAIGGIGGLGGLGGGGGPGPTAIAPGDVPVNGPTDVPAVDPQPDASTNNPFADESGGIAEHAATPAAANPSDPFVSPQATPDPLYGDGPQVDGPGSSGADSAKTDYINPDGTPLGSSPAAAQATGVHPHTGTSAHGVTHKPDSTGGS